MNKNSGKNFQEKDKSLNFPLINDYPSREEWERASWRKILTSQGLLKTIITSHERHNLVMRAAVLDRLAVGKTYRQIGEELWLSPQTISVIKKVITEKNYRSYSERSKKERRKRIFSSSSTPFKKIKQKSGGIPRRTKYGTIYIP